MRTLMLTLKASISVTFECCLLIVSDNRTNVPHSQPINNNLCYENHFLLETVLVMITFL